MRPRRWYKHPHPRPNVNWKLPGTDFFSGGLCGSVALDDGFKCFVLSKMGETQYNSMKVRARRDLLEDFDQGVKRSFEWASTKSYWIRVIGVPDNELEGIKDEYLKIGS